ncbi:MAG: elongation factor P [Verrucomicrobiota bacterium]
MAIVATKLSKGQCIDYKGEKGIVLHIEHRTPGKGNALIMATVRSFHSGKTKDIRFASGEKVDIVNADRQKLEFSYNDQEGYHFMDASYDTITLQSELLEGSEELLKETMEVEVLFLDGKPVTVELPATVDLEVVEAAEGLKGDTANNPTKPAKLETGLEVQVPLFVKTGDILKINTETKKYMSRV